MAGILQGWISIQGSVAQLLCWIALLVWATCNNGISYDICITLRATQLVLARRFHIPNNFRAESIWRARSSKPPLNLHL